MRSSKKCSWPGELGLGVDISALACPSVRETGGWERTEKVLICWRPMDIAQACMELIGRVAYTEGGIL